MTELGDKILEDEVIVHNALHGIDETETTGGLGTLVVMLTEVEVLNEKLKTANAGYAMEISKRAGAIAQQILSTDWHPWSEDPARKALDVVWSLRIVARQRWRDGDR